MCGKITEPAERLQKETLTSSPPDPSRVSPRLQSGRSSGNKNHSYPRRHVGKNDPRATQQYYVSTSFMQAFFLWASSLPSSLATSAGDTPLSVFFWRSFITREHTASIVADIVIRRFSSIKSCAREEAGRRERGGDDKQQRGGGKKLLSGRERGQIAGKRKQHRTLQDCRWGFGSTRELPQVCASSCTPK